MTNQIIFIDSNVWLYRFLADQDPNPKEDFRNRKIAISLTNLKTIVISTQVINEVCSILKKKVKFSEDKIFQLIEEFEQQCLVINLTTSILKTASKLRMNCNLSFWDGLIIDNQLTIINPFKI
jgi:predicted nucleic acid-binding protein